MKKPMGLSRLNSLAARAAGEPHKHEDDERAMQRMEAEGDLAQTMRDERNKHAARAAMERVPVNFRSVVKEGPLPTDNHMRGQLRTLEALRAYVLGGNATVTVKSERTGTRFTYQFVRPKDAHGAHIVGGAGNKDNRPIWVSVLAGQDNNSDYRFLGSIWPKDWMFSTSKKTTPTLMDAPCMHGARWLAGLLRHDTNTLEKVRNKFKAFEQAEFWHEGKCGRCGRKLTVPSSIDSGFGPECITKV